MDSLLLQRGRAWRNAQCDFVDWHRGRPWFLLWALDLDVPALRSRWQAARQALQPLLLEDYRRQPHLTLGLCGFAAARRHRPDECDAVTLQRQMNGLAAAGLAPFALRVGAADSFAAAPYLAVPHGSDQIARLRQALQLDAPLQQLAEYVPHVTLGLYREEWPLAQVRAYLARVPSGRPVELVVREVSLLAYRSADVGGVLRRVATVALGGRPVRPHAGNSLHADVQALFQA